jgi:hypothetical protein
LELGSALLAPAAPAISSAHRQWLQVLDELEAYLQFIPGGTADEDAEEDFDEAVQWSPPDDLGPLPPELVARAHRLLRGQRELVRKLEQAQQTAGRHLAVLRAVPAARSPDASVYLDVIT